MIQKRLLLITPDFPPNTGGVARYLSGLCLYFGSQILVVTPAHESLSYKYLWPHWLKIVWIFLRDRSTYDYAITSHVIPIGTAAWMVSWFTKKPFVVIVHGMDVRLCYQSIWKQWLLKSILSHAHRVIANTKSLETELHDRFHLTNTTVIYPCVEPTNMDSIQHKTKRLLTVSRLVKRKSHLRVLEAIAAIRDQLPPFTYTIVGSGPMQQKIELKIQSLHLEDIVQMLGDVSDAELHRLYASSDVFVMPVMDDAIDKEGFGMVFLEAALHHAPSISTKISGIDEAILDGETGILVEDGNELQLERAIEQLLTDEQERTRMGNNAYDRTVSEFGCVQQFSKLDDVFL